MRQLTSAETFILQNWRDVARLQAAVESMAQWMLEDVVAELRRKAWWSNEYDVLQVANQGEIDVFKNSWRVGDGKWDMIGFGAYSLHPEPLMGHDLDKWWRPAGYVWASSKVRRSVFNATLVKVAAKQLNKLRSQPLEGDDDEFPVLYEFEVKPEEWLAHLKKGTYVKTVCGEFDKLAQLVRPIEHALSAARSAKRSR